MDFYRSMIRVGGAEVGVGEGEAAVELVVVGGGDPGARDGERGRRVDGGEASVLCGGGRWEGGFGWLGPLHLLVMWDRASLESRNRLKQFTLLLFSEKGKENRKDELTGASTVTTGGRRSTSTIRVRVSRW